MPNTEKILFVIAIVALTPAAVYISMQRQVAMSPVALTEVVDLQDQASSTQDSSLTPYGYDRDDLGLGEWRISADVKRAIEGPRGCGAISQPAEAYVPVSFGDGAPCEVVRKDGALIVYGVGYESSYEGLGHLGDVIYVFKDDGFYSVTDTPGVPDLRTFTPEHSAALDYFSETHEVDFGSPDWNAYYYLNLSYLRKELEPLSPRVTEAMRKLKEHVSSLVP